MASDHRPPVLFQSDDDDHRHIHNSNNDHSHHAFGDGHTADPRSTGLLGHQHNDLLHGQGSIHPHPHADGHEYSQERGHGRLYDELENLDDSPPHVHSQVCLDSCPVQDIYTETSFSRFSKGARTNLYGLVVVKELGQVTTTSATRSTTPSGIELSDQTTQDSQLTSTSKSETEPPTEAVRDSGLAPNVAHVRSKSSIFTETGDLTYRHFPGRYVLVAAGGVVKVFLGLQDTFEFTLGPSEFSPPQGVGAGSEGAGGGSVATAPAPNLEIVSMDAFERKDERGCQLVLVASVAKAEDPAQFELRFYGVNTFAPSIRELLLQLPSTTDIQSVPLTWAPTKIIHAPLEDDPFEMVVLVGGSDSRVHLFVQDAADALPADCHFKEQPVENLFSVLASFPYCEYCVLSLVIKDYLTCRVIAAGTQNGTLNVGIIPRDPVTFQLDRANAKAHTVVLFSPITTLTVYTSRVQVEQRRQQHYQQSKQVDQDGRDAGLGSVDQDDDFEEEEEDGIHLLVTCATEQAWVYSDINKYGLIRRADLAECSYHDSIMAAHTMDADWDGQNEVLIGTYGRQLMVFKQLPPGQEPYSKSSSVHQQKQPQQSSQQYPNHHNHQHHNQRSPSSSQQLQRQLRNSFQMQQQLQLQQLQQQQILQQQQSQLQQIHLLGPTVSSPSAIGDGGSSGRNGMSLTPQWGMTWNRRFASPVYGISSADLNDDGLEELVITTINGVSFFLPDPRTAKRRLAQAVERMREIKEMREILEQLRRDNRKLVEDQRVKEEKEKVEEERRRAKAEEEAAAAAAVKAARKDKEKLEWEESERKEKEEKEEKVLEEQRIHERRQQEEFEKEMAHEPDQERVEAEEQEKEAQTMDAAESAAENVKEQAPAKAENRVQSDGEVNASQVIDAEAKKITSIVGDEEKERDTAESMVEVGESKEKNDETSEVLEDQAEVQQESPEQEPSEQELSEQDSPDQEPVQEEPRNLEGIRCDQPSLLESFENADNEYKFGSVSGARSKQAKE
ncbi:hypothetical protein BG015_003251 [Linnemannia schmuckeri]|uniref:Uncharacterized protein n=1 Tax=Linnemannia schmuckeri TaxID=64567 RepID=A0A9P5S581_9FUNG|nr:hypothetical protein BG015_003251 [Linnemannia schmuckeri]